MQQKGVLRSDRFTAFSVCLSALSCNGFDFFSNEPDNRHQKRRKHDADVYDVFQYGQHLVYYNPYRYKCCDNKRNFKSYSHVFRSVIDNNVDKASNKDQQPHAYLFCDAADAYITADLFLSVLGRHKSRYVVDDIACDHEKYGNCQYSQKIHDC